MKNKSKYKSWFTFTFALMVIFSSVFAVNPASTFAAGCSGRGCDGTDPQSTGCSANSFTVVTRAIREYRTGQQIGIVELRYSPSCGTNWTRTTNWVSATTLWATITRISSSVDEYQTIKGPFKQIWSKQVYAPVQAAGGWGCINTPSSGPNCTFTGMY